MHHVYSMITKLLREFILALESNIKSDSELLVLVLVNLRALYQSFLTSSVPKEVCFVSEDGTILGVLDEVRL